ncbi:LuxR C-terminal-related transcriptional regulator [Clostridium lacusfryxellense]|uniref:LuxR C-terminal-related transcriptional regulator n=1 Tax=Clostridium lacusfryxellense TaxID=205328 RepID=UPI001FE61402|nr:LuxR C-terminal-related transcriptional regulator [Clostridium lacusfryxellense]
MDYPGVEDNDPVRFIGLLATALQQLQPECGNSVWPLISGGEVSGSVMKHAVGILINDIVRFIPDPFILVLDDLHSVTESAVYVALDYLLNQLPTNLHIVIGTRYDPPLRLARLAARRQLGELRRSNFSLNQDETYKLLNDTLGLALTVDEVAILQKRTEGWPGVLCLLAGSLARMSNLEHRSELMTAFNHTEREVLDFLSEEILLNLPKDIQRFLMQTSILSEMTPSDCQAVTGHDDAAEVLAELYHRNLAIASLSIEIKNEPVYRYHSLFAQLLTKQLEREMPGEIKELHRRAAEVQTTPGRAISHYFSACLWDQAAQLMVNSGMQLLLQGMSETFRKWYGALPVETRNQFTYLTVILARCEIHNGDYTAARRLLNGSREAFVSKCDNIGEGGTLTSLITLSYENNDRMAVATYVKRALELPLDPMGQVAVYLSQAWLCTHDCDWEGARINIRKGLAIPSATGDRRADITGITYMSAPLASLPGCLELAESYCAEVSILSKSDTPWYLRARELGTWPLLWRGQIEEALVMAKSAEALRQMLGGHSYIGNDLPLLLSVIYLAKGDLNSAGKSVDTLIQRADKSGRSRMMLHLHAAGRSLAFLGRYEEALIMQQRLETLLDDNFALTQYLFLHLKGLLALLCEVTEASDILQKALELEDQLPMAHVGGSARLLQARLLINQGKSDRTFDVAHPVLSRWGNSSTPGYALFDGPIIIPVLRLAVEHNTVGAARMLDLFSKNIFPTTANNVTVENKITKEQLKIPLTPRECDVLRLLVAGLTNVQISGELYISKETVKSHVEHIFNKLDVHSRTQAVIRASKLDI